MEELELMEKLIEDVRNMSIEEYLVFHEEAMIMKNRYDDMINRLSSYDYEKYNFKSHYAVVSKNLNDTCIESKYKRFTIKKINRKEENEWELAA